MTILKERVQQLLDHMNESAIYGEADLLPFRVRIDELRSIVRADVESGKHPEAMTRLLERQLNECGTHMRVTRPRSEIANCTSLQSTDSVLNDMQDSLSVLSVELVPVHERLVVLRRQLAMLSAKEEVTKQDLKPIMDDLRKIDGFVRAVRTAPE
jgi:hypothetical protein